MTEAVARLLDPKYLTYRPLQELFHRAFEHSSVYPQGFAGLAKDLIDLIQRPDDAIVLVGTEDDIPKAMCLILLPSSQFAPLPQVLHIYNEGGRLLRKKLIKTGVESLRQLGHMKFHAINASGKPDSVWARTLKQAGKATVIGGIVEFDMKDA